MKILFFTLGCKVNQYETQSMEEVLVNNGYSIVMDNELPDFIVINSCTVTSESDRKTRQLIRRCKRNYPNAVVVLTGCMAQAFPEKSQEISEADIILGNSKYADIAIVLQEYIDKHQRKIDVPPHLMGEKYNTPLITDFSERTRAFLKIEDGCNRFCSYCIIPTARGRVRSKSTDNIKTEALALSKKGFSEIVLVGINLSAYGTDINLELSDAVNAVAGVDGIKRIRLGSLEPDQISDETLDFLASCEKFCPQFHLSLQSGCNRTLKRMNRHYDVDFYEELIKRIRNKFGNPSITTDIMVGFAGENEEDFIESLRFANKIKFAKSHVFAYSRREGTLAYDMPGQISNTLKEERSHRMIAATLASEYDFCSSQIGQKVRVLFESFDGEFYEGYSENHTHVKVKFNRNIISEIFDVKITDCKNSVCIGEIIDEEAVTYE